MPKIAILDDYAGAALGLADWGSLAGFEAIAFGDNMVGHDALVARLADFEIVCAMRERTPFPAAVFERLPKLKLFITSGMRNKSVDFAAARRMGVVCCGTATSGTTTTEHTWALILATARHVPHDHLVMREGGWQTRMGFDLAGKTLGCVGLGRLGSAVARIGASAFGMKVIAWSQNLTAERCAEVGAELVSKEELFERADVVTIHLLLSDRTTGLIDAADLARMKPSAILVNTSRGPIVDETALLEVLRERRIRAAAIDVFSQEPLPADAPIRRLDNVVLTPHIGYVTEDTYRLFYGQMVENIAAWAKGSPIRMIEAYEGLMAERVLVTGGARSIGRGIVERMIEEGYEPVILDRVPPEPAAVDARWIEVDLMDGEQTDEAVREALAEGPITRVVHNVGHVRPDLLEDTRLDDFDAVMALNVRPAIRITQALLPGMRRAGFGRIVAISSRAALGKELRSSYAASKAALHGLMKTWALELARDGITANAIGPGSIETPLWHAANPSQDPRTQRILDSIPVGRLGTPADIANGVAFFLDARSGFVTGQVLYICGGLTVGSARA